MSQLNLCLLFCLVALCASGSLNQEKSNELLCLYTGKFKDEIEKVYVEHKLKNETRFPDVLYHLSPLQMDGFTKNQYPLNFTYEDSHEKTSDLFVAEIKNGEVVYYILQNSSNSTPNKKTIGEQFEINKYHIAWNFTDFNDGQFKGGSASACFWVNFFPTGKLNFKVGCQPTSYLTSELTKKESAKFPPNWPCKK